MSWDRFVKLFHWSMATGIVANYFFLEDGDQPHEWLGYVLCAFVAARIIWGFYGPTNARFSSFLGSPLTALREVRSLNKSHELPDTHTVAGGYQLLFVMGLVLGLGATGWIHDLDAFWGEDWPADVHEYMATALIILAGVHISAVAWMQLALKMPVLRRMWLFRRKRTGH